MCGTTGRNKDYGLACIVGMVPMVGYNPLPLRSLNAFNCALLRDGPVQLAINF